MLVKPYSPTPRHLTKFKLSLIDNHMPPCYMPFIFFYNNPTPGRTGSKLYRQRLDDLKSSLAHTLTRFYPLAGRLSNPDHDGGDSIPVVHCNDNGVPFSFSVLPNDGESLDSFMVRRGKEVVDSLQRFLPFPAHLITTPAGVESAPQIAIKATVFPCGGIAVGVCLLHKIVDTHTLVDFMKLWAATARGNKRVGLSLSACAHDQSATWRLFPAHRDDSSVNRRTRRQPALRLLLFSSSPATWRPASCPSSSPAGDRREGQSTILFELSILKTGEFFPQSRYSTAASFLSAVRCRCEKSTQKKKKRWMVALLYSTDNADFD
ncbi:unnamed protein product [Linum tenue]|uniref:Uncharacterized protein n=1 Tax=Linum tenue TaxID=586396 RepID=A0AAV0I3A9_9ROSI|nr:unnamed protein product [Linum tenue]